MVACSSVEPKRWLKAHQHASRKSCIVFRLVFVKRLNADSLGSFLTCPADCRGPKMASKRGRGGAAGNKFRMSLGLPVGAILNCADNTGAKNLYVISVVGLGSTPQSSALSCMWRHGHGHSQEGKA